MAVGNNAHRRRFQDVSTTVNMTAGADPSANPLIAGKTGHTIFVQQITVHVTTAAAQTLTFRDDAGTPIVIAVLPASAAVGDVHVLLSDPEGVGLTEGQDLDLSASAAGIAGQIAVTAYSKPTGTMTQAQLQANT